MSKIIFTDVDGTLVTYENRLPQSAITAIRAARAKGHKVYLCTGRSEGEMQQEIWDIGVDGMIGGNGSYIKDHDTVVMHRHLSLEDCRNVVDWCRGRGLEFYLESNSGIYASEKFETKALDACRTYMSRKGKTVDKLRVRDVMPQMIFGKSGEELYRDDVLKISFVLKSYGDYLDAKAYFADYQVNTWGGAGETALFGDVGVKGISKEEAVGVLLDYLGETRENTIAFGDAKVDIPMFRACGYCVAMGSGGRECKEAADYVTDAVDQDGFYKAFAYLGLL